MQTLYGPIIGIVGVIVGIIINEFLRRSRRAEEYSSDIFKKRLRAYETLMVLINDGNDVANEVINNVALTPGDRHDLISHAIEPIAKHVDRNVLYIDEYLAAQCVALFMGVEDIPETTEPEKTALLREFYNSRREAKRMIAEDSGIAQINRLFKSINRPKITGPIIERIKELRREQEKKERRDG